MRLVVIGMGYVGLALAEAARSNGIQVLGIDTSLERVEYANQELGFNASINYTNMGTPDVVVIAVPTPLTKDGIPDLQFLISACKELAKCLTSKTLIVNESTSYPGTLRNVIAPIFGNQHLLASAPERIDPGNTAWRIENTPRLVSGITSEATREAIDFYSRLCREVVEVATPEVAEAAKLFENTFRQVNIALVNEFAQIAKALGISADETLEAAATKPFGFMKFIPSLGVGGHCIPVDPSYLIYAAKGAGVDAVLINQANVINSKMPNYVVKGITLLLGGSLLGKSIQVAGISYKSNVPDLRESPALVLIEQLRELGANVIWHDDVVNQWNDENSSALEEVDLGVIATAHADVDYSAWTRGRTKVIDVSTSPNTGWPKYL
jgi:UDP-N-acetyl-D-glucosamine dehydrogenase